MLTRQEKDQFQPDVDDCLQLRHRAGYAPVNMSVYSLTSSSSVIYGAGAVASTSRPSESSTRKVGMAVWAVGLWNSSLSVNLLLTAPGNWILETWRQLRFIEAV